MINLPCASVELVASDTGGVTVRIPQTNHPDLPTVTTARVSNGLAGLRFTSDGEGLAVLKIELATSFLAAEDLGERWFINYRLLISAERKKKTP